MKGKPNMVMLVPDNIIMGMIRSSGEDQNLCTLRNIYGTSQSTQNTYKYMNTHNDMKVMIQDIHSNANHNNTHNDACEIAKQTQI